MGYFLQRLRAFPLVTAELLIASLFANLLALASPLFVIQVLNRYVAHGIDATLMTLTAGVMLAIAFEFAFREIRQKLAAAVVQPFDDKLADDAFSVLIGARSGALDRVPPGQQREIIAGVETVQQSYGAPNITALLDVPYALIFVVALFLLSPWLALIVVAFVFIIGFIAITSLSRLRKPNAELQQISAQRNGMLNSAIGGADTVRAFNSAGFVRGKWRETIDALAMTKNSLTNGQGRLQNFTQSAQATMSALIIATGATLVVRGQLDVGALIGSNILAARALGPLIKLSHLSEPLAKARQALAQLAEFAKLPMERTTGSALRAYSGRLEFKDLGFVFPGSSAPLFESVSFRMEPGASLIVTGANGTGKTTLARLVMGLLEPSRGQILIDGLNLSQTVPEWWRRQVIYLPQEPKFVPGSLRDNILSYNPDLNDTALSYLVREAGLEQFVSQSPEGLDTQLVNDGGNLSVGIRRRLALARALASNGRLLLLDEPTDGMDAQGSAVIARLLQKASADGRTVIIMSHDPNIVQGAPFMLDLNSKPVPRLIQVGNVPVGGAQGPAGGKIPHAPMPSELAYGSPLSGKGR